MATISFARDVLSSTGLLMEGDLDFPLAYHDAWIKKCLANSVARNLGDAEIRRRTKTWAMEVGAVAYSCQIIEGACKELLKGRYHREMPPVLLKIIDSGLGKTKKSLIDSIKTQIMKELDDIEGRQLSLPMT